ncbi:MAG: chromosomal replication initiator protein DnaA [Verrucomicrobia bacterium]|nr:chromosomal replication initiator protein DnaA [Verrucomicrobiota bacterium]MBS0646639.1 chromosomal replication initiator protein DnaA [Verrucomicrobiota bacterium]
MEENVHNVTTTLTCDAHSSWQQFLDYVRGRCSQTAFENWLAPITVVETASQEICLSVPNIFVKAYLLDNYKQELALFFPLDTQGELAITFVIGQPKERVAVVAPARPSPTQQVAEEDLEFQLKLNQFYSFDNFIEGPSNQFVKSAALGIAAKPSRSYNPLFIHGGVGLGKTHLLHAIGHYIKQHHKKLRIQCITTEGFINDLVDCLRNKSVDKMKRFYRSLDVLLVDDIQFLQNRLNFEEEFCNTFESLINQNKQIVITSDKPPGQLKLSERIVARMEWGLVAHVGAPDLETRVAILQHKAEQKGLVLPNHVAFFIAENIYANVRQLEGAINRLTAHCRLLDQQITEELAEKTLSELFQLVPKQKVSVEHILKAVASVFQVRVNDLRGTCRTKDIALARQVAMYLAKELINDSLIMIGAAFGKTHSTILHACKTIENKIKNEESLRRQIALCRRSIGN